jgi:hypothetical protein
VFGRYGERHKGGEGPAALIDGENWRSPWESTNGRPPARFPVAKRAPEADELRIVKLTIEEFRRAGAEIRKWRKTEAQKRRTSATIPIPDWAAKNPVADAWEFAHVLYFARDFFQHEGAGSKKTRFDGKNREGRAAPRRLTNAAAGGSLAGVGE